MQTGIQTVKHIDQKRGVDREGQEGHEEAAQSGGAVVVQHSGRIEDAGRGGKGHDLEYVEVDGVVQGDPPPCK